MNEERSVRAMESIKRRFAAREAAAKDAPKTSIGGLKTEKSPVGELENPA